MDSLLHFAAINRHLEEVQLPMVHLTKTKVFVPFWCSEMVRGEGEVEDVAEEIETIAKFGFFPIDLSLYKLESNGLD